MFLLEFFTFCFWLSPDISLKNNDLEGQRKKRKLMQLKSEKEKC